MKWFFGFFLICSIGFCQTENDSTSVSQDIGVLGSQFYNGQLMAISMGKSAYLQTGLLQIKTNNAIVSEMPILFKTKVANDFQAFFGTKLKLVQNPLFSVLQQGNPSMDYGASIEAGIQYDVNDKMMLELRYSIPVIKNKDFYPNVPNLNATPMLRLGTGFQF